VLQIRSLQDCVGFVLQDCVGLCYRTVGFCVTGLLGFVLQDCVVLCYRTVWFCVTGMCGFCARQVTLAQVFNTVFQFSTVTPPLLHPLSIHHCSIHCRSTTAPSTVTPPLLHPLSLHHCSIHCHSTTAPYSFVYNRRHKILTTDSFIK
jgi:hypothetical protein